MNKALNEVFESTNATRRELMLEPNKPDGVASDETFTETIDAKMTALIKRMNKSRKK